MKCVAFRRARKDRMDEKSMSVNEKKNDGTEQRHID